MSTEEETKAEDGVSDYLQQKIFEIMCNHGCSTWMTNFVLSLIRFTDSRRGRRTKAF